MLLEGLADRPTRSDTVTMKRANALAFVVGLGETLRWRQAGLG